MAQSKNYIVTYETYNEYNQFEGSWDNGQASFSTEAKARRFIKDIKKSNDYRAIELSKKIPI